MMKWKLNYGHELEVFFLQQPEYDLLQQSIVAKGCDAIPPVDQYLDVDWQFTAGPIIRLKFKITSLIRRKQEILLVLIQNLI